MCWLHDSTATSVLQHFFNHALKFESLLLRLEKYHNPLVAEEESSSSRMTNTSKIFLICFFPLLMVIKRKLARILMQKFSQLVKHAQNRRKCFIEDIDFQQIYAKWICLTKGLHCHGYIMILLLSVLHDFYSDPYTLYKNSIMKNMTPFWSLLLFT